MGFEYCIYHRRNEIQERQRCDLVLPCLLLVDGDALEGLLDDPAAVHLQGELLDVGAELQEGSRLGEGIFKMRQ